MTDKLFDSLQKAAGELPLGWLIELCVERGAGWVELYDADGDRHELEDMPDASLAEEVDAALIEALRASGLAPPSTQETVTVPVLPISEADEATVDALIARRLGPETRVEAQRDPNRCNYCGKLIEQCNC